MTVSGFLKGAFAVAAIGTAAYFTFGAAMNPALVGFGAKASVATGSTLNAFGTAATWTGSQVSALGGWMAGGTPAVAAATPSVF